MSVFESNMPFPGCHRPLKVRHASFRNFRAQGNTTQLPGGQGLHGCLSGAKEGSL